MRDASMRRRLRVYACLAVLAITALAPAAAQAEESGSEGVAWGRNTRGQLGAGFATNNGGEESPVSVLGLSNIVEMASGQGNAEHGFALALLSNGTVEGWGDGEFGVLGKGEGEHKAETCLHETKLEEEPKEGEEEEVEIPGKVRIGSLSDVKQISAAGTYAAALLTDGKVVAWGNNEEGQHGNGKGGFVCETQESDGTIAEVKGLEKAESIVSGDGADLALVDNEGTTEVKAWGRNIENNLGVEVPSKEQQKNEKEEVKHDEEVKAERKHEEEEGKEVAPLEMPERYCNTSVGVVQCSKVPRTVLGLKEVAEKETTKEKEEDVHIVQIAAGKGTYAALYSNGTVRAWGGAGFNLGGAEKEFDKVPGLGEGETFGKVVAIAVGASQDKEQTLALLADGKVVGWGNDDFGQLGVDPEECKSKDGTKSKCFKAPHEIPGLEDITAISAGYEASYALNSSGTVYALGDNHYEQLGTGNIKEKSEVATAVTGIGTVSQIDAGERSVYAVLGSGVKAPSPAMTVAASEMDGVQFLTTSYTFKEVNGKGFKRCIRLKGGKCTVTHLSSAEEEAKSFVFGLLTASTEYTITLGNGEKNRAINAETLP
jgi:alpha-tubulin suppressor-like RCC1 family protein